MQCPTSNLLVFESDKLDEHLSALEGDQPVAHFGLKALNDVLGGDRKSTRLNSSHSDRSRMPSSA